MKKAMAGAAIAAGEIAKTKAGQKTISQVGDSTARASKIIGWSIIGLVSIAGAFLLYKVISKAIQKGKENADERAAVKEEQLVLQELDKEGIKPTPNLNEKDIANAIQAALGGCDEDEEAVYTQMRRLNNDADWAALKTAWGGEDGKRMIADCFYGGTEYPLTEALVNLFSQAERDVINQIFASKGMKSRI
jgi:hypothetical protein